MQPRVEASKLMRFVKDQLAQTKGIQKVQKMMKGFLETTEIRSFNLY